MSSEEPTSDGRGDPTFESAVPVLSVEHLDTALAFYRDLLGFEVGWTQGEPLTMASVCRGRAELHLAQRGLHGPRDTSCVYLFVTGIRGYYAELVDRGAKPTAPLAEQEYGMLDFELVDPSGNVLVFGEAVAP